MQGELFHSYRCTKKNLELPSFERNADPLQSSDSVRLRHLERSRGGSEDGNRCTAFLLYKTGQLYCIILLVSGVIMLHIVTTTQPWC
jgi:hypothetical protein